ncbi:MAG TPA: hypothetical protein VM784_08305 [Actinomycetota bacterium]|nr:hypothetical protein [Actinomycetota bacterium]
MSFRMLMFLTILEIVALVVVLAIYLSLVSKHLRSIAATLAKVTFGVRAVEQQLNVIGPGVGKVNQILEETAGALPGIAEKAERLAAKR